MRFALAALVALAVCLMPLRAGAAEAPAAPATQADPPRIYLYLDCQECDADYLRTEVSVVDHVRDRAAADVHVLITTAATAAGGTEHTLAFIGRPPRFGGLDGTLKAITTSSDPEDTVRRQLLTALRVGLLPYLTRGAVPPDLVVDVEARRADARVAESRDPWNAWVFSLRGSAAFEGEESSRQRELGLEIGASRITPDWKLTFGAELDHEREEFDLDEDDPVEVERREREFDALAVKGLGPHWSIGVRGGVESSTFDNQALVVDLAPAVEHNFFPYAVYTRRQLRAEYAVGMRRLSYYEPTLLGKLAETRPRHQVSLTYEQRERWGSLEARTEWSQYLHDPGKTRLEAEGLVSLRVARGLSVDGELQASRIRDQIFLPRRDATPEEVLLRLRRLQSGYEYGFTLSVTYTFGSIFSAIVNPRFGN